MNFLIIGSGSIATRHATNLLKLGHKIDVYSTYQKSLIKEVLNHSISFVEQLILEKYDGIIIANKTEDHLHYANICIAERIPFFVEKPLSNTLHNVKDLRDKIDALELVVECGFFLQAHPQINLIRSMLSDAILGEIYYVRASVGQWLPDWRPNRDYRKGYAAHSKSGGVLFDLIHEVELVQSLFGKIYEKQILKQSCAALEIHTEAISTINGRIDTTILCHIEMDYIRRKYSRNIEIVGDAGTLNWDLYNHVVKHETSTTEMIYELDRDIKNVRDNMFIDHMKHFIKRISDPSLPPMSSIASSISALETIKG